MWQRSGVHEADAVDVGRVEITREQTEQSCQERFVPPVKEVKTDETICVLTRRVHGRHFSETHRLVQIGLVTVRTFVSVQFSSMFYKLRASAMQQ